MKKQKLQRLVEKHGGNLSAIARETSNREKPITRQAVAGRLRRAGLAGFAAVTRVESTVAGPRAKGVASAADERATLLDALTNNPTFRTAHEALGMTRRTFYRKLAQHGINSIVVAKLRAK